jgi:hypothetical protein
VTRGPSVETVTLLEPITVLEERLCNRIFDLAAQPPLQLVLAEDEHNTHVVLVGHHAAMDGYSLHLLSRELWLAYAAFTHGRAPLLGPEPAEFRAYKRTTEAADIEWWRAKLATYPAQLSLPTTEIQALHPSRLTPHIRQSCPRSSPLPCTLARPRAECPRSSSCSPPAHVASQSGATGHRSR